MERHQRKQFLLAYLQCAFKVKDWMEVARIKEEINVLLKSYAMGFLVRSRFKQNCEEEKASIFHAAREMSNGKSSISALKIGGNLVYDQKMSKKFCIFSMHFLMVTIIVNFRILVKVLSQIMHSYQIY